MNIKSIAAQACILILVPNGFAMAENSPLQIKSDATYNQLKNCIESSNNDASACIEQYKEYISAEIKSINSGNSDDGKKRLKVTVAHLKKVAEIFYEKGVADNSLIYKNKAAILAEVIVSLGDEEEYKRFQTYIDSVKKEQDSKNADPIVLQTADDLNRTTFGDPELIHKLEKAIQLIKSLESRITDPTKGKYKSAMQNAYRAGKTSLESMLENINKNKAESFSMVGYDNKVFSLYYADSGRANEREIIALKDNIKTSIENNVKVIGGEIDKLFEMEQGGEYEKARKLYDLARAGLNMGSIPFLVEN